METYKDQLVKEILMATEAQELDLIARKIQAISDLEEQLD